MEGKMQCNNTVNNYDNTFSNDLLSSSENRWPAPTHYLTSMPINVYTSVQPRPPRPNTGTRRNKIFTKTPHLTMGLCTDDQIYKAPHLTMGLCKFNSGISIPAPIRFQQHFLNSNVSGLLYSSKEKLIK